MGKEKKEDEELKPDWKDFIAMTVALLQTTLLPIVIMISVLALLLLIFTLVFR